MYEAIIIGGGPAGLSAALVLGRCRRKVLVVDSGRPRNGVSRALHGYLTRDGVSPFELRRLGRAELALYPTVEFVDDTVADTQPFDGGFQIILKTAGLRRTQLLLLATGRDDTLPAKPGFNAFYGKGVFHCPYCDGWEHRDQRLVVYGNGRRAVDIGLELLTWSTAITICTDGAPVWEEKEDAILAQQGIEVISEEVESLAGGQRLERIIFKEREALECGAVFFLSDYRQRSSLPERLGCSFDDEWSVRCNGNAATNVRGLYVAGNVRGGLHFAITAAAEGVEAAVAMNDALLEAGFAARGETHDISTCENPKHL